MILAGASLVLPDRVLISGTIVVEHGLIADIRDATGRVAHDADAIDLQRCLIVPGFIDVHVHGVMGHDTLDGGGAIAAIARALPPFGVTAFCPTTVACSAEALASVLDSVSRAKHADEPSAASVLPAHLESNFINAEYRGAQPRNCLCLPPRLGDVATSRPDSELSHRILDVVLSARESVSIVTLAPELPEALPLIRTLVDHGYRVSLGHSGASFDEGLAAVAAGATQATHLFNRMPSFGHRDPGLAGAMLHADDVTVELICDGRHVHPAVVRMAVAAKTDRRAMAITDGTACSGLPPGAEARLGGQRITARDAACFLDDGTLAGSVATMDAAFRLLVGRVGIPLVSAARLCATSPAEALGLKDRGALTVGARADLTVLDADLHVERTYVGGNLAYKRET